MRRDVASGKCERNGAWAGVGRSAVVLALLFLGGCASWKSHLAGSSATPTRQQRQDDAIREFEEHRDAAQFAAALDRWEQGNDAEAEAMLTALVARRPDLAEARLRLGEMQWARGDPAAEEHLRAALASAADSGPDGEPHNAAAAHHALALLLAGTGREAEAREHFLRAAELEPENAIYRDTCQSLAERPNERYAAPAAQ